MTETTETLPLATPEKLPKPYGYRVKRMSLRQLRGEVRWYIPGTKQHKKNKDFQSDLCSTAIMTVMELFLNSHEAGRAPFLR